MKTVFEKKAELILRECIDESGPDGVDSFMNDVRFDLNLTKNTSDQIRYLTIIIEGVQRYFMAHKNTCKKYKKNLRCDEGDDYEEIIYLLNQELENLGIVTNEDTFTTEEKKDAEDKLDQILQDLQTIKNGQEILFEEIEELKKWFVLGKKSWRQLLIGKFSDMVTSGIISETVSKELIGLFKDLPKLLTGNS